MTYSAQRVVDFIGNLAQLFHSEEIEHQRVARSLRDGTVIRPPKEDDAEPEEHTSSSGGRATPVGLVKSLRT